MADVLCCFSDGPIEGDPFPKGERFQISLDRACCENPGCCIAGACCPCCASWKVRRDYLRNDMTQYSCCQNELPPCCCFKPGQMGEQSCPNFCLCCEACCCTIQSISSTRSSIMRTYGLTSDPFDRKLIRCTNCLMVASCVCQLCGCKGKSWVRDAARLMMTLVMGCMVGQVDNQMLYHQHATNGQVLSQGLNDPEIVYGEIVDESAPLVKHDMKR